MGLQIRGVPWLRTEGRRRTSASQLYLNEETVGYVVGRPHSHWAERLASMLVFQLEQDDEKRALAAEVLDKYRELHLLYRLSEKLVSSPHPEAIARIALNEANPLIQAQAGMVLLADQNEDGIVLLAT